MGAQVLVVEDEADLRSALVELLSIWGYRVSTARDGREALERLRAGRGPMLMLLDLQMPVMDGWRFRAAQQLLSNVRVAAVPVVLMTGSDNAEKNAQALHAAGFVEKPFQPDLLLGAVLKALKASRPAALDRRMRS